MFFIILIASPYMHQVTVTCDYFKSTPLLRVCLHPSLKTLTERSSLAISKLRAHKQTPTPPPPQTHTHTFHHRNSFCSKMHYACNEMMPPGTTIRGERKSTWEEEGFVFSTMTVSCASSLDRGEDV